MSIKKITYNGSSKVIIRICNAINALIDEGGSSTLAGLTDVDLNNLTNDQIIKYNVTTQKWENADESGGGGGGELVDIFNGASTVSLASYNGITLISSNVTDLVGTASMSEWSNGYEGFNIALQNLVVGKMYTLKFKFRVTSGAWFPNMQYRFGYMITSTNRSDYSNYTQWSENLDRDLNEHSHSVDFTATETTMYLSFNICGFSDNITNYFTISELRVKTMGGSGSTVSYSQTLSSGTETGEITIDGVATKMYAPTPPTKVSDLQNDTGFITSTVSNLINYYTKTETYTKAEVDAAIAAVSTLNLLVVQTLPTQDISTTTIYLVPKQTAGTQNVYDEYIYIVTGGSGAWELIGDTTVDLSNYYTKTEVNNLLSAKVSDNPTFTEAATRANIASGESFATILGKIKKWFTDLKDLAFIAKDGSTSKYLRGDGTWQTFPTIPAAQVNSDWNANSGVSQILNKPTIPSAVAVKGDNESSYRTGNVNLTADNIGAVVSYGNLRDTIGSNTPAQATKTFYDNTVASTAMDIKGAYNNAGTEYSLLFGNGGANYGNVLKWGYDDRYIYLLRKKNGTWLDTDWVKIYAGYADTAGSATTAGTAEHATVSDDVPAWAKASSKPSYNHSEIGAGALTVGNGANYLLMRTQDTWEAGMYYHTDSDEAMVFANRNTKASWIFANTNPVDRTNWRNLSPAMHIKNGKVAIGKLIPTGTNLTYPLEVNGDVKADNFRGALKGNADTATMIDSSEEDIIKYSGALKFKQTGYSGNYTYNNGGFGVKNGLDTGYATIYASNVGSSLKFKENVQTMTDEEAEKLLKIRVVTYDYKRGIGIADGADAYNQRGVIAEEVNSIIPYVVIKRELGSDGSVLEPYGVEYHKFIPYLIKMIQIQQDEIDELKAQIKEIMEVIK